MHVARIPAQLANRPHKIQALLLNNTQLHKQIDNNFNSKYNKTPVDVVELSPHSKYLAPEIQWREILPRGAEKNN